MTREETKSVIKILCDTYPNFSPGNLTGTVDVWTDIFAEYPKELVAMALKMYIRSNNSGFAPVPGQIMDNISSLQQERQLSESEAWALVLKAIRNSGYHSVEEYNKLPRIAQMAVGSPTQLQGWACGDISALGVAQSNFERAYRSLVIEKRDYDKYMPDARAYIGEKSLPQSTKIPCIEVSDVSYTFGGALMPNAVERKINEIKGGKQ